MPVLQQDSTAGDIIGGLLGTAGAFFQGQQQAKQQKAEQARQAALDAQTVAESLWQHHRQADADARATTKAGQEATTFENQQTDRAQTEATATALAHFQARMKYPANWNKMKPEQQIAYLQQRLNKEQQMPGAEKLVAQTQKEIEDIQRPIVAAANQAAASSRAAGAQATQRRDTDVRESGALNRLNIRIENPGRGSGGANSDLTQRGEAVENAAMGAPDLKSALRIVERANLPRRDRAEVRQDVMDQFKEPAPRDLSGLSNKGQNDYRRDQTIWQLNGMDPDAVPDPNNPKYEKKITVIGGGNRGGSPARPTPQPAATPPPSGGGGKTVSLKAAMALPQNRGKTPDQVRADIQAHGYSVAP